MSDRLKNRIGANFSTKLSLLLIVFNVVLVLCFSLVKYFFIKVDTEKCERMAVGSALDTSVFVFSEYMEPYYTKAGSASAMSSVSDWFMGGDDESGVIENAEKFFAESDDRIWYIRESDSRYISSKDTGFARLASYQWYTYYTGGGKEISMIRSVQGLFGGSECIMLISPVFENDNLLGFTGIELDYDTFCADFDQYVPADGCRLTITDDSGNVVYPDGAAVPEEGAGNGSVICRSGEVPECAWKIYVSLDSSKFGKNVLESFVNEMVLLGCLVLLQIIAILNVVRRECRTIPAISRSIAEISAGNYNFRINSDGGNEIALIARSVDDMAQSLQDKNAIIDDYVNLDTLTGLKNRVKMYEAIDDLIVSRDYSQPQFALAFIDIDNFRWINETLGHKYGDEVLKVFAQRLKSVYSRIYRFSSDMFVALIEIKDDSSIVDRLAQEMSVQLVKPVEVYTSKLYVKCSEGVAIYPDDAQTPDALLRNADIALSRAKERGKNRLSYYSTALRKMVINKAAIAQNLTKALEKGEFYLNYQPIISTADNSIHGFEVLLRWESEELGYVPPSHFVQIAEETGDIVNIGAWIFETGCRFLKRVNEYNKDIIMSINVSPIQMRKHDYMEHVRRVLDITKVNTANVQVEITESSLIDFMERGDNVIEEINSLGIALALDDFGTGYSSLNYLKNFPIKCLKVDKSFVDEIDRRGKDYAITGSIVDMVHGLGIKTVAEGVETIAQYNSIVNMKCDYIQGFLMSKPMDEEAALEFVKMYDIMHKPDREQLEKTEKKLAEERMNMASAK